MNTESKLWPEVEVTSDMYPIWDVGGEEEKVITSVTVKSGREWEIYFQKGGCFEVIRHSNLDTPSPDTDQIHICDMGEFIERLQEAHRIAKEQFGEGWEG